MATDFRNMDLSLYYRIFGILQQEGYYTVASGVSLDPVDMETFPTAPSGSYYVQPYDKPWVFIDTNGDPWPSGVTVYVDGVVQDPSTYQVDYLNSRVIFPGTPSGAVTADLWTNTFHVVDSYPDDTWLADHDLPVIAISLERQRTKNYAIGTSAKWRIQSGTCDILATDKGMQRDMLDEIQKYIIKTDLIDYSEHSPLLPNGSLDLQYSYADQFIKLMHFLDSQGTVVRPRTGGSDKELYRSLVVFELESVS